MKNYNKTRTFLKNRPDARTGAEKEDVSGETRTYGNPTMESCQLSSSLQISLFTPYAYIGPNYGCIRMETHIGSRKYICVFACLWAVCLYECTIYKIDSASISWTQHTGNDAGDSTY